jgi:hypothetical protein
MELVHSGAQVTGLPEQPVVPAALKADRALLDAPAYTSPLATAGETVLLIPVAVHSGEQGLAEQPAALKA